MGLIVTTTYLPQNFVEKTWQCTDRLETTKSTKDFSLESSHYTVLLDQIYLSVPIRREEKNGISMRDLSSESRAVPNPVKSFIQAFRVYREFVCVFVWLFSWHVLFL